MVWVNLSIVINRNQKAEKKFKEIQKNIVLDSIWNKKNQNAIHFENYVHT